MRPFLKAKGLRLALLFVLVAGIAFAAGRLLAPAGGGESAEVAASVVDKTQAYSCSMHPQIRQPGPGKCPICGMDLTPVPDGGDDDEGGPVRLELSEAAAARMAVTVAPVTRQPVDHVVRLSGRIEFDETRLHSVVSRAEGEVRRLFLDNRFARVRRGEHLLEVYSPPIHNAFLELNIAKNSGGPLLESARRKLQLLGVSAAEIARVERTGRVSETFTLYSPADGVLGDLNVRRGQWVERGELLMRIADLSEVWAVLSAYESDLPWLSWGQRVELTLESQPGVKIETTISYIEPVVDPSSRTAKVRVQLANLHGQLKPGMFVRADVHVPINSGGDTLPVDLKGQWICPMHPDEVSSKPGRCSRCGMLLESAESLYAAPEALEESPLLIPASAPLLTGRRALVYVRVPAKRPTFEPRDVVLGPRAGNFYVVQEGLEEGELVVEHGSFRIDSELQIRGRPSMMASREGDGHGDHDHHDHHGHHHGEDDWKAPKHERLAIPAAVEPKLGAVFEAYLQVSEALAADDFAASKRGAVKVQSALADLKSGEFKAERSKSGGAKTEAKTEASTRKGSKTEGAKAGGAETKAAQLWEELAPKLQNAAHQIAESQDIEEARKAFDALSQAAMEALDAYGPGSASGVRKAYCPMAFDDRGAAWLQSKEVVDNPYFGEAMLRCGELEEVDSDSKSGAGEGSSSGPSSSAGDGHGGHGGHEGHEGHGGHGQ